MKLCPVGDCLTCDQVRVAASDGKPALVYDLALAKERIHFLEQLQRIGNQQIAGLEITLKQAIVALEQAVVDAVAKARTLHEQREAVAESEALLLVLKYRTAIEAAKRLLL